MASADIDNPYRPLVSRAAMYAREYELRGATLDLQASRLPWWHFRARRQYRNAAAHCYTLAHRWKARRYTMSNNADLWDAMMDAHDDAE